jgi:membrane-bound serine protease (ClpP class)
MTRLFFFLVFLSSAPLFGAEPAPARARAVPIILVASYSGVINPPSAEFIQGAIDAAAARKSAAVVLELDTPGGLDLSMRDVIKSILASQVPVIVYVSPAGGRAASAGVFITMAAHVAAMAPGTNIGAAHPVELGAPSSKEKGKTDPVMEAKIENDMGAYLQAIAARRGRNTAWAREVVVKSVSVVSAEAVRLKVVDLEAENLEALLDAVDGRTLSDFPGRPLRTAKAAIERFEMTRRQRLLAAVSDPNIAMVLMTLGVSGLLIELYSPGLILPGLVGAVSLILAFYSFHTLSAVFAGFMLILVGFILFILELKVTSFGLLGLSGTAAVLFGGMMLFRDNIGGLHVSGGILLGTLGTLLAVMAGLLILVKKVLSRRPLTGAAGLEGSLCTAATPLEPRGTVLLVGGELWRAESLEGPQKAGSELFVESVEGLTLRVRVRRWGGKLP